MPWKSIESLACSRCGVVKNREAFLTKSGTLQQSRLCWDCRKSSQKGLPALTEKRCPDFGVVKPRSEYYPKRQTVRGQFVGTSIRPECKPCGIAKQNILNKLRAYNLTAEKYREMRARGCEICGDMIGDRRGLTIDHDHVTGKVRGTLCGHCNKGVGFFRNDTGLLLKAIQYLDCQDAGRSEVSGL